MFKPLMSILLFICAAPALFSQIRIVPHVTTADGGFSTTVVIENTSVVSQVVTLTPFDKDGNQLDASQQTLAAHSVLRSNAHELLGNDTSHFTIEGSDDIKVNTYYDFKAGGSSPAFVGESTSQGSIWRIFPGNWDKVFDGIAIVNTGSSATDVWINQKNEQNEIVATKKIWSDLAPNAKTLFVIGSPSLREFSDENSYFEVSSSQMLAVTALQGTLENETLNLLLASESRPLGKSSSKRDDRGIWFIEGGSLYDVFEMQGYNVATDRLWQMEIFRRQARGTLAEIVSASQIPNVVAIDVLARSLAYSNDELDAYYADMDDESKVMLQSYIDGINRRIAEVNATPEALPVEFTAVGETTVSNWNMHDIMAHIATFQVGFSMRGYGNEQVLNAARLQDLTDKYGAEQAAIMFNDIRFVSDPEAQTMISGDPSKTRVKTDQPLAYLREDLGDIGSGARELVERIESVSRTYKKHGIQVKGGSYAWAVHGSKTASGNPILYSGPQVNFGAPSLFVEGSIVSDAVSVSGMAIPGIPSVIVGRTPHHAWSMQVGYAGTWDYYMEDPADVTVVRQETIVSKDGDNRVIDIEASSHGPILGYIDGRPVAWKYAHRDYNFELSKGLLGLARAQSMDDFGVAAENLAVTQHLCYADSDGNIAYWHAGRQPVRPPGDYRLPQGMLEGQEILEWDAAVREPIAHVRNPAKGYIAGWNNKPEPDFIDYSATQAIGPYHRGHVIEEFFENYDPENKWTFEELSDLAVDIGATGNWAAGGNPWTKLGQAITDAVNANPTDERLAALALFDDWDGRQITGGRENWVHGTDIHDASYLLDAMIPNLLTKTFDDEIGAGTVTAHSILRFQTFLHGINDTGLDNAYDWFSNLEDAGAPQTSEAIIIAVLDELLTEFGANPWGINKRGTIDYPHSLFGPITALGLTTPTLNARRATYAMCVEYGNSGPVRIESIFALGQSGTITGALFAPILDMNTLSMKEDFDNFVLRSFPLFP